MSKHKQDYLAGKLLLAMPEVGDPRFHRAVIYMCEHNEDGAMGLIINQEAPGLKFQSVLEQCLTASDEHIELSKLPSTVLSGGPVNPGQGFLLHSPEFQQKDTFNIDDSFSVTSTMDALRDIAAGQGPKDFLFILGYAGWSAGQLEEEILQNAWLVCDPSPDLVFHEKRESKWEKAIATLGFDPMMLSSNAGHA